MCQPRHFEVTYSINPWMDPDKPTDTALAVLQWERLRRLYLSLGHRVELIEPLPGMPDMVFAANGATVVDGRALAARFRYPERAAEADAYRDWLRGAGFEVHDPRFTNEGEGDYLVTAERILAGTGFRTDPSSHAEARELFGRPVTTLQLVDERYYHLDTALTVLDDGADGHPAEIMYYPPAFSPSSRNVLEELYPDAIIATDHDAEAFGLNAVSDGRHVLLSAQATQLTAQLRERGFQPIGVDLSELRKSGGSAKCCTLELREAKP